MLKQLTSSSQVLWFVYNSGLIVLPMNMYFGFLFYLGYLRHYTKLHYTWLHTHTKKIQFHVT